MPHVLNQKSAGEFFLAPSAGSRREPDLELLSELGRVLRIHEGFDLGRYKPSCAWRRLEALLERRGEGVLEQTLLSRAELDEGLRAALVDSLSIHHSEFFRNPELYRALGGTALPMLLERHRMGLPVRILSAGCSRGEETYSLALWVLENAPQLLSGAGCEIRGLDRDASAIATARRGVYERGRLRQLPVATLEKYFRPLSDERMVAGSALRAPVRFETGDLFEAAALGDESFDLIFLRNVLIYLTRPAQEELIKCMFRLLRPGGYLVLGKTEFLGAASAKELVAENRSERIYRKLEPKARASRWSGTRKAAARP